MDVYLGSESWFVSQSRGPVPEIPESVMSGHSSSISLAQGLGWGHCARQKLRGKALPDDSESRSLSPGTDNPAQFWDGQRQMLTSSASRALRPGFRFRSQSQPAM